MAGRASALRPLEVLGAISRLEESTDCNVNGAREDVTSGCCCCCRCFLLLLFRLPVVDFFLSGVHSLDASNSVRKLSNLGGSSGSNRTSGVNGSGSESNAP